VKLLARLLAVLIAVALNLNGSQAATPSPASPPAPRLAATPAVPLGTGFSYQGQLKRDNLPFSGTCDLRAGLWDTAAGGAQLGVTQTLALTPVTNGLFTVALNAAGEFGPGAYGAARWLQLEVRCPAGSGAYTALSPRQALSAAPAAHYAQSAPWTGLTGVPPGFADGVDDDALGALACAAEQVPRWTGGAWTCSDAPGRYAHVVIVAPAGGDFTSIQAALDSVTGTVAGPYLVWVAPGVYAENVRMKPYVDLAGAGEHLTRITARGSTLDTTGTVVGASNAELRDLTIENTGLAGGYTFAKALYANAATALHVVRVTARAGGADQALGVHLVATTAVLEHVSAYGADAQWSWGILNDIGHVTLNDVTADARSGRAGGLVTGIGSEIADGPMTDVRVTAGDAPGAGGYAYGLFIMHSSITLTNAIVDVSGAEVLYGIYDNHGPSPMRNVAVRAIGGAGVEVNALWQYISDPILENVDLTASSQSGADVYGVHSWGASTAMHSVTIRALGGKATYGIRTEGSAPVLDDVQVTSSGPTVAYALFAADSSATITDSTLTAKGAADNYGLVLSTSGNSYQVTLDASQLTGSTSTIRADPRVLVQVGAGKLAGGPITGSGPVTCVGVYDENYASAGYSVCP
jgi:hypothetical protein